MKKTKSQELDLFYDKEEKKTKKKEKAGKKKPASKKVAEEKEDVFNFDDEIVIGVTKKEEPKKKKEKQNKAKKEKQTPKKKEKTPQVPKKKKQKNPMKKSHKRALHIAEFLFLFTLIVGGGVYFLLSPTFNIKTITVTNNQKIGTEEIISLSGINLEENMFKIRLGQAEEKIKENPYVEKVEISRKLPDEIQIEVTERVPTYMLELMGGMVYLNNQGYFLEITENKLAVPTIVGYETVAEEIKPGNRLCETDLRKLGTVLKIMETANSYEIGNLITRIGIADKNNYTLWLEGEKKTVYLGDASNINTRIMYLKEILEAEKGVESEVFINGDMNQDDVYTREKV